MSSRGRLHLGVAAGISFAFAGVTAQLAPPTQVHTAFFGTDIYVNDGFTVSWATDANTTTSVVLYGLTPALGSAAQGPGAVAYLPTSYVPSAGFHHHVQITGLTPSTTYFFSCGDSAGGFSPVFNFTTAPPAGQTPFPLSVVTYADMGVYNSETSRVDVGRILPQSAFILHVGDVS